MSKRDSYSTGVQDQLQAAANANDKGTVVSIIETVMQEDPELGEALGRKVISDSLQKARRTR
ncbi:hypothetical protein ACFWY5_37185 [Nonomuraea sp. NPDC059007]|uniref:hypothetical protein n=1 Tax=Nonomuraea sp. NPDC059007 TaxID=3346692 RepID=UPI0036B7336A